MHQLLRDAHGSAPQCYRDEEVPRPDAKEWPPCRLDGKNQARPRWVGGSCEVEEASTHLRQFMSDLFHEAVPERFVAEVWDVMKATPRHTYQILTKRPDRMAQLTASLPELANVWLGTSVENADFLYRIDDLRNVRAVVRFISFEPLLGSVAAVDLSRIHWAIVGGESGPRSRPMLEEWVDEIEAACRDFGTAFFFKQWGGVRKVATGRIYRDRTFDEMPAVARPAVV